MPPSSLHGVTTQKTTWIFITMKTSNLMSIFWVKVKLSLSLTKYHAMKMYPLLN
jgi:hypothetical protein